MSSTRRFRSWHQALLSGGVVGAIGIGLMAGAADFRGPPGPATWAFQGLQASVGLGLIALSIRLLRSAVVVGPHVVTIRNPLRTRRFSVDEIGRFEVGTWGIFTVAVAALGDGTRYHAWGIQPANLGPDRIAHLVLQINGAVEALRDRQD